LIRGGRNWHKAFLKRFDGREDIGKRHLYERYFASEGLPRDAVYACLDLLAFEYEMPAGILRPSNKLEKLFAPIPTSNPFAWFFYRAREQDSQAEVNYRLAKRMRQYGTLGKWLKIETVNDLIRAWCGLTPPTK